MQPRYHQGFDRKIDKFVYHVDSLSQYAADLQQKVDDYSAQQPQDAVLKSLEELNCALEELRVAEEELKAQNEELAIARQLAEAERQRYQDLFEMAPDGYLVTDSAGKIQEANRAAAKLLNVSQEFLIGKLLINFIPFTERRIFRHKLNQLLIAEWQQEWELRICPRQAESFEAGITVSTVRDLHGKAVGWRWIVRNLTPRKQAEEKIRQVELQNMQLQAAAKLKSHFLALMSHELRTPMNAIVGFSQLLLRQADQSLAEKQEKMVERILNSGRHLLRLIDDLLDFSKFEVDSLKLKLEPLNLAELVTETIEDIRSLVDRKDVVLQVNLNLQNPFIVNDSDRLRQVLVNLLSNAIKFTDAGRVQVEVWELAADRIVIAVKDTGIGIAEEDFQEIFQEFWQVNQTITRKHGGTGLGLAIADKLVRLMQGKITVESELGKGSTFQVELPRWVSG